MRGAPAMLRWIFLAPIVGLSALVACSPGQQASQGGAAPGLMSGSAALIPDKDCGFVGGVKVLPCPIRLTRYTKTGIVVTVSGPAVVNSYLGRINSCFNGRLCYNAEREG